MKNNKFENLNILEEEVEKAKRGDKNAKHYVILFFEPFIKSMSKKTFIKNMDPDDIEQSLNLYLLIAIEKYKSNNKFFWYAIQTMKNNIFTDLKKSKKNSVTVDIEKVSIADEYYIDDNLMYEEDISELYIGLNKLKKKDFDLLFKIYFENYNYEDLVKFFNKPYSTISSRKNRALRKLKSLIN